MTKKHFIALADAFRLVKDRLEQSDPTSIFHNDPMATFNALLEEIIDVCYANNPRFNRQLFRDYINGECEPNGGKLR